MPLRVARRGAKRGIRVTWQFRATADALEEVAHLVHPAALMRHMWVDGLDGRGQTRTAIGDNQL
jgi:hypothetical protein